MIEKISYLSSDEAIKLHAELMESFGEIRCGLSSREMLESALARPQNEAVYNDADLILRPLRCISGW